MFSKHFVLEKECIVVWKKLSLFDKNEDIMRKILKYNSSKSF